MDRFLQTPHRCTFTYCKPLVIEPGKPPRELNRLDTKNWTPTPAEVQRQLIAALRGEAERIDALVIMDQVDLAETGVITAGVLDAVGELARQRPQLRILADSRRGLGGYPAVCWKMNRDELGKLCGGGPPADIDQVSRAAGELARRNGREVFVTLAEDGILAAMPDGQALHAAALPIRGEIDIVGGGRCGHGQPGRGLGCRRFAHGGPGTGRRRGLGRHSSTRHHRHGVGRSNCGNEGIATLECGGLPPLSITASNTSSPDQRYVTFNEKRWQATTLQSKKETFMRQATFLVLTAILGLTTAARADEPITLQSLLAEMVDRDSLARLPAPPIAVSRPVATTGHRPTPPIPRPGSPTTITSSSSAPKTTRGGRNGSSWSTRGPAASPVSGSRCMDPRTTN